ncbi:hypothetical protein [Micromonospora profundi]|uniref:hypothetical protein n=1 Tax=Micromonospora profundi TaxID=1420889 RepID=UPI0036539737
MSIRLAWITAGCLFAAAVTLAVADVWLPAAGLMFPLGWLAGKCHARYRVAVLSAALLLVAAELERARGEVFRLTDELATWWDRAHEGRFADEPPLSDRRPDWVDVNVKADAAPRVPVSERTTTNP